MKTTTTFAFLAGSLTMILGIAPTQTRAANVTFNFTGTVTGNFDFGFSPDPEFVIGEAVAGSYTFDPSTADTDPSPNTGIYSGAISAFTITFGTGAGAYTASANGGDIIVRNDFIFAPGFEANDQYGLFINSSDWVSVPNAAGEGSPSEPFLDADGWLIDNTSTAFGSDALPVSPPDLSAFTPRDWFFAYDLDEDLAVGFQINTLTIVPEPGTLLLGVLASAGFLVRRRRLI